MQCEKQQRRNNTTRRQNVLSAALWHASISTQQFWAPLLRKHTIFDKRSNVKQKATKTIVCLPAPDRVHTIHIHFGSLESSVKYKHINRLWFASFSRKYGENFPLSVFGMRALQITRQINGSAYAIDLATHMEFATNALFGRAVVYSVDFV